MFSSSKLTARPGNFGWNITFIPVKLCVFVPETGWWFDNMRDLRMKESLFQKEVLFVVCQCLSYLYCNGLVSIRCNSWNCQWKKSPAAICASNVNTKTDNQRKTFYCDEFPSPLTVHVVFLFCFQEFLFLKFMEGIISRWLCQFAAESEPIQTHRTRCCCVFLFRQVSLFSLFQMAFLKRKSNSFSLSAEKRGHPIWLKKNGSINEENHTVGIV